MQDSGRKKNRYSQYMTKSKQFATPAKQQTKGIAVPMSAQRRKNGCNSTNLSSAKRETNAYPISSSTNQ
jgi:hypothetical protein